jgi:hypothetical protein
MINRTHHVARALLVVALLSPAPIGAAQTTAAAVDIAALRQAAERGDPASMLRLGGAYRDGAGVARDLVEGAAWITAGGVLAEGDARKPFEEAMRQIDTMMTPAQGPPGVLRAGEILKRIAAAGHPRAQFVAGSLSLEGSPQFGFAKDNALALQWMIKAAESGYLDGQMFAGKAYFEGLHGVLQDYRQAAHWYQKAAEQGNPIGALVVGTMYEKGWGQPRDMVRAAQWYLKAADQGQPDAQSIIGRLYEAGVGVDRDHVEAHKWLNIAASRATGESQQAAIDARNRLTPQMSPEQIAAAQARARAWLDAFVKRR